MVHGFPVRLHALRAVCSTYCLYHKFMRDIYMKSDLEFELVCERRCSKSRVMDHYALWIDYDVFTF